MINKDLMACQQLATLRNNKGTVYAWREDEKEGPRVFRFASMGEANDYIRIAHEIDAEHGRAAASYIIGDVKDYRKAVKVWQRKKAADEVKAFAAHVDNLIQVERAKIECLEALPSVLHQFDGKILNKRFADAVEAATGGWLFHFETYAVTIRNYMRCFGYQNAPEIYIRADYDGRNTGDAHPWTWGTGDRLEAEKAAYIIASVKNDCLAKIEQMGTTKKTYSEYLKKARKAAELIEELRSYDYSMRDWAKNHDLPRVLAVHVFRG